MTGGKSEKIEKIGGGCASELQYKISKVGCRRIQKINGQLGIIRVTKEWVSIPELLQISRQLVKM